MAEKGRIGKEGKLELGFARGVVCDVMSLPHAGADKSNAKKVGEVKIYNYSLEGVRGQVVLKQVYDNCSRFKDSYFANIPPIAGNFTEIEVSEKLSLMKSLGVSSNYIYLDSQRGID